MSKHSVVSSYTEKRKMHDLLNEHLHQIGDSEFYRYEENWNDERVAISINPKFSSWHTQALRIEIFGKLKARGNVLLYKVGGTSRKRIAILEEQLRRLIEYCGCNDQETADILGNAESNNLDEES